jgi:hypothetical protein
VNRVHGSGGPRAGGGSRVHGGLADGARPELTGARAAGRYGSPVVAASGRGGGERRRGADLVLTGGRGALELAGCEREQAAAVAIGVERLGARIGGKERRGERGVERRRRRHFNGEMMAAGQLLSFGSPCADGARQAAAHDAATPTGRWRRHGRPEEEEGGHRVGRGPEWRGGPNAS